MIRADHLWEIDNNDIFLVTDHDVELVEVAMN
jgi:hypothetical protein